VISGACEKPFQVEPIGGLLKELTYRFSVAYRPDEFTAVIDGLIAGDVQARPLLGRTVGLDRVGDALDMVRTGAVDGRVLVAPAAGSPTAEEHR
jgi:threonine dehydrogenase-like Zn-dependent dehydrogenase